MQKFKRFTLLFSLFLLNLVGCGSNDGAALMGSLVGVWKISPTSSLAQASKSPNVSNGASLGRTLDAMSIELRQDKTFISTIGRRMEGTWSVDDSGLVTMNGTVGGLNVSGGVNIFCQLDTTNNTLTMTNSKTEGNDTPTMSLVFVRQ